MSQCQVLLIYERKEKAKHTAPDSGNNEHTEFHIHKLNHILPIALT